MEKLKRLLSESSKQIRHRRNLLNLHITFLAWLMEVFWTALFLGGTLIIGHENQVLTFFMQTVSLMIRFVILPFIILINDTEWKQKMIESSWYNLFLDRLNCQYNDQDENDEENKDDDDCQLHGQNEIDINVIDLES